MELRPEEPEFGTINIEAKPVGVVDTNKEDDQTNSQEETELSLTKDPINEIISPQLKKQLSDAYELMNKCKEVYQDHKLDEAHRILEQFLSLKDSLATEDLPAYGELQAKEQAMIDDMQEQYAYLHKVLVELESTEEWKSDQINSNVKIYYKKADNDLVTIKMEAEVDVPVLHLLSMINEVELWKLWNAFMNKTAEVKTLHRAAKVYYVEYGLPYPLANREIYLYGIGVNRLHENGTIVILAQSVDDNKEFFEKHDFKKVDHSGTINIDVHLGAFEITPIGRNKCILKGLANINPKFNWIPKNILNWVLRKGTKQMVDKIISGAKHFKGSAWEKEIKSERKREFYEWLEDQLEQFHSQEKKL